MSPGFRRANEQNRQLATHTFVAGPEWTEHRFEIMEFGGIDGSELMGLLFSALREGDFDFQIDSVRLEE